MWSKPYLAGMVLVLAIIQAPLRAEEDPATLLRNSGGGGIAIDPSHNGGTGGFGGRYTAPGYGGGKLQNYISQCMAGRPVGGNSLLTSGTGGGSNIFTQSCSSCHALPSVQASINAITNGVPVNGVITKMPPGNAATGQEVLRFLQAQ